MSCHQIYHGHMNTLFEKCDEKYRNAPGASCVYYINFTTEEESKCYIPTADYRTPLIHVRHDKKGKVLGLLVKVHGQASAISVKVPVPEGEEMAIKDQDVLEPHNISFPSHSI